MQNLDVIIIGAGAAGLMCAIEAAKGGKQVLVLERNKYAAQKIRISGGGRCNFTNVNTHKNKFISENPNFMISAIKRYKPDHFINLVEQYGIEYHEKTLGQLFCNDSAQQIIDMLLDQCEKNGVQIKTQIEVISSEKAGDLYEVKTNDGSFKATNMVLATGGPSIPKMGATPLGYVMAKQYGHSVIPTRPGLVPLTFSDDMKVHLAELAGISVKEIEIKIKNKKIKQKFREALLFTHRGLSGPAILQISSYWREGMEIVINLMPNKDVFELLVETKAKQPKLMLHNFLSQFFAKKLAVYITEEVNIDAPLGTLSDKKLRQIAQFIHQWEILPNGTEGNRTAEVTLGGVNTKEISSKSFESNLSEGLFVIGELLDVTGHLGGYNFQWAWASGHACGQAIAQQ